MRRRLARPEPYDPDVYWERRSSELIEGYEHPETWAERGWDLLLRTPESTVVPELLARHGARSVLVAGAGSGRQYEYLVNHRLDVSGFDLSPTMVAECVRRFPGIETTVDNVVGCDAHQRAADAVLAVTVLQHVRPEEIGAAVESLRRLANRLLIVLETTQLGEASSYLFAHDYASLMAGWEPIVRETVRAEGGDRSELLAWARPANDERRASSRQA